MNFIVLALPVNLNLLSASKLHRDGGKPDKAIVVCCLEYFYVISNLNANEFYRHGTPSKAVYVCAQQLPQVGVFTRTGRQMRMCTWEMGI